MKNDIKFVTLPTTTDLTRTNKPLNIKCVTNEGDGEGETTVEPHLGEYGGAKGAVMGLGIGWVYDRLTDAAYDYPTPIIIPLHAKAPEKPKEQ